MRAHGKSSDMKPSEHFLAPTPMLFSNPGGHVYRFASFFLDEPGTPNAFLRGRLRSLGVT